MTDDLVTEARKGGPCAEFGDRCRAIEAASGCFCAAVADRIEQLQAQNLRLSGMCYDLKKEVAISDALLISEGEASLERLARAEKAEAERDRLRKALERIVTYLSEPAGEADEEDTMNLLRGDLRFVGRTAHLALNTGKADT